MGVRRREEKRDSACGKPEKSCRTYGWHSQQLWEATGPDLPQAEWQARVRGLLSPGSSEIPRCSGKNPVGGSCPEPSSQALPHMKPPVSAELLSVNIANTALQVRVR